MDIIHKTNQKTLKSGEKKGEQLGTLVSEEWHGGELLDFLFEIYIYISPDLELKKPAL